MEKDSAESLQVSNMEKLQTLLIQCGAPLEMWGLGKAKTVEHLLKEVEDGESVLSVSENGELVRTVSSVWLDVFAVDRDGGRWYLREDRQVFNDEERRERRRELSTSLGEKMMPGEDVEEAVYRALEEELKITDVEQFTYKGNVQTTRPSNSYPGLISIHDVHEVRVELGAGSFDPNGYKEEQEDKTTYFVWEPATP
jgi:hypothetical protein